MDNIGLVNAKHGADTFGFRNLKRVYWNLEAARLYEESLGRREAQLVKGGALLAETGIHTGRSPKDKFVVRDGTTESTVWWDNNGAISPGQFDVLLADMLKHAEGKELFAQDLYGGADLAHRVKVRVFTEYACTRCSSAMLRARKRPTGRFRAGDDHRRPAILQGRPGPSWLPLRDRHRLRFHPQDRFDRRHLLCRRDEEIGLHLSQLHPARRRRDADALFGQCRREG